MSREAEGGLGDDIMELKEENVTRKRDYKDWPWVLGRSDL